MKLPSPRLSVRTALILVAVTGASVWGWVMWRRSGAFSAIAREHAATEASLSQPWNAATEPMSDGRLWTQAERVALYRGLRRKYERAARHPWLSVEPDPPLPQVVAGFDIQSMEGR
jgi:hypothetical protein